MSDQHKTHLGPNGEVMSFQTMEIEKDASGTPINITIDKKEFPFPMSRELPIVYHPDICTREELMEIMESNTTREMISKCYIPLTGTSVHPHDIKSAIRQDDVIACIHDVTFGEDPSISNVGKLDRVHAYFSQTDAVPSNLWMSIQSGIIHARVVPDIIRTKDGVPNRLISMVIQIVQPDGTIDYNGIKITDI